MRAMDAGIKVELDTRDGELNLSPLAADRPGSPKSPLLLTPNLGHAASTPAVNAEGGKVS